MSLSVASVEASMTPVMTAFEATFIQTVLEHRQIRERPTLQELAAALDLLRRYDQQCQDDSSSGGAWEPDVEGETLVALRAKAFLLFGVTKPSPVQWRKAHESLFGPLLCETCG